jgi:isocitrate/isopropylmalate dehydrogenase
MSQRTAPPRSSSSTALQVAIDRGTHTADLGGSASTSAFAKAVIAVMRNAGVAG